MNGRLNRCRICRSAFLSIKDVFKTSYAWIPLASRNGTLNRIPEEQGSYRRLFSGAAVRSSAISRRQTGGRDSSRRSVAVQVRLFVSTVAFCAGVSPPLRVLELDSQTSCHAIESLAIDAENLCGASAVLGRVQHM